MAFPPSVDSALDLTVLDSTVGDISIQTIEADTSIHPDDHRPEFPRFHFDGPDPDLCLTPEKTPKTVTVSRHVTHDRHVRFDVPGSGSDTSVENKENITARDRNDDMDVIETEVNSPIRHYYYDVNVDDEPQHDVVKLGPRIDNHQNRAVFKEVVEPPQNREVRLKLPKFINTQGAFIEEEHIFKKPELHTTLRVGLELKNLHRREPQIIPKVEDKLQTTSVQYEKLKKQEKALNIEDEMFMGRFTNLDVSETGIITRKERDIKTKTPKPSTLENTRAQEKTYPDPDIMECWMDSLETETYSASLPGYSTPAPSLRAAENYSLYDHLRAWNI